MAIDLIHHIYIAAPRERIYQAITTADGIKSWWTTDVSMSRRVGGKAVFGFFNHSVYFQMRIAHLERPTRVQWRCEGGNSKEWVGTTQEFVLEPPTDGEVLLRFRHAGWKSGRGYCYQCNTTWGHLLVTLKDFVERGRQKPYFT